MGEVTVNWLIVKTCKTERRRMSLTHWWCSASGTAAACRPTNLSCINYATKQRRGVLVKIIIPVKAWLMSQSDESVSWNCLVIYCIPNESVCFPAYRPPHSLWPTICYMKHGWFQSPRVLNSGRTPMISVTHPICPSIHYLYLHFRAILTPYAGKRPVWVSGLSQSDTFTHVFTRVEAAVSPPREPLSCSSKAAAPRGKNLVKSSQVKFICASQYHITRLGGLYRLTTATVTGPGRALEEEAQ